MSSVVAVTLEVDAGESVQEVQALEDAIKDIQKTTNIDNVEDKFDSLNKSIEGNANSVEGLRKAIKSYQTIALTAGRESPVGKEAILRASQLTDQLTDLDNEVKRLSMDGQQMQTALQLGSTLTAGYQAFAGVTALVGEENEDLMKTMVKLQGVQSVLQGIEQIRLATEKESILTLNIKNARTKIATALQTAYSVAVGAGTKAMKGFKTALVATGLGALVVLLGYIVTKWDEWTEAIFGNKRALELRNEVQEKAIENSAEELSALDKLQKLITENVNDRKAQVKAVQEFQEKHPELLKGLDAEKTSYEDINKQIEANIALVKLKAEADAISEIRVEKFKEKLQEQSDALLGSNVGLEDYAESLLSWDGAIGVLTGNLAQRTNALTKTTKQNSQERINDLNKEINILDGFDKKVQSSILEIEKGLINNKVTSEDSEKSITEVKKTELEKRFELEYQFTDKMLAELQRRLELRKKQAQEEKDYFDNLDDEYFREQALKNVNQNKQDIASSEERKDALIQNRMQLFKAYSDITGQISNLAGQQTKAGKALALAEIGINTALGFTNGLIIAQDGAKATGPAAPFAFPIFYATQVAAVLNAANKAKSILKAGSPVSAPSISSTPSISGRTSGGADNTNNTSTEFVNNEPTRVYVVESDIQAIRERRNDVESVSVI
jgi:hypothetical protein